ncbi:bifunctional diaminohydroxyphosphoribosylaminopyrimidine deaminase/5-amino-6-(5-phosphoribosylamino)uracil reductase RibD [Clostridium sp. D53t1_180928_C8]|uniref:bifunctional diaminohydroxyphosphoribosylaminopyrimidine deaminase/5-amino-6-(5-phosphoribosylamino)uracil reductase RibD n=1 Tax=Clostridium sp. D53t1_180928_C8 TaxID=2787101 RepID=UPI0018AA0465|nr:bifunctional diaminohydroxyphosphoribosylaminopyrimidine deaminase/5-amino-6-(5-phosphoribosylamino)uracil reductase RibD [Clostridium sp. D53t1_180928_C8]
MNEYFMKKAIELARKGVGKVNPNPLVGSIIVKNGKIIGEGYHENYGEDHAEVNAFKSLKEDPSGATIYVTLEPCSHCGKTPPCADKIIENKISKVVIGMVDPNPLVAGNGIEKLKNAGIEVEVGVLESECIKLNEVFLKYIIAKRPFVVLKAAMSIDGKISTKTGESKWISCEESRLQVHKLRNKLSGIMVGVNTVIKDNPELTCRLESGNSPIRIIVDSTLRIPFNSKVLNNKDNKTIIATTNKADMSKVEEISKMNAKVLIIDEKDGRVDLNKLMAKLGELNIDSILLEGGAILNYSALEEKIVDKVMMYISPKIIGGEESKTPIGGYGIDKLNNAFKLKNIKTSIVGADILVEGYIS